MSRDRADWEEAQHIAKSQGADGAWFIDDKWGGYWQAGTKYGAYTFRTAACVPATAFMTEQRQ